VGDVKRARWMLDGPLRLRSTQARGRGIGTRLLVPTVNLAAYDGLLPAFGFMSRGSMWAGAAFKRDQLWETVHVP